MAHLRCDFRSEVLDMNTSMTVVLPEGVPQSEVRVIYLFHGLADNCSGWSRYTSVERYAREHRVALVIPEVQRSFYADMENGLPYFTFIHEELPRICGHFFGFSHVREQTFLMGLSMGGYAAIKCAFATPERYAAIAAFSAPADMVEFVDTLPENRRQFQAVFGPRCEVPEHCDLFKLASKSGRKPLPRLYMACGEQDSLYPANLRLSRLLTDSGEDIRFEHWAGDHNWIFWDQAVERAMNYLLQD